MRTLYLKVTFDDPSPTSGDLVILERMDAEDFAYAIEETFPAMSRYIRIDIDHDRVEPTGGER